MLLSRAGINYSHTAIGENIPVIPDFEEAELKVVNDVLCLISTLQVQSDHVLDKNMEQGS